MIGGTPKTNLRVLIHDGARSCEPYNIIDSVSITGYTGIPPTPIYTNVGELNVTTYPMVHHMNDPFNASFDINFAICDFYYYPNIGLTNNNLFNVYWRRTVNQINRGKMLSAYFDLDEDDIQTLRLNDKIRIDNSWWNINRIQDYNANSRTLTKVELLSIDDELSLPKFKSPRPITIGNIRVPVRFIVEQFYRNNNVNLSEGSVIVKGIGNVVNEGREGFVQGDYKVITTSGYNGLDGGENFANTDLTFTGNRSHDTDGNDLLITTDGGVGAESIFYMAPSRILIGGIGGIRVVGSLSMTYNNYDATHTATNQDYIIDCIKDIDFTVNLPTASGINIGRVYIIKNSGSGTITVDPDGAQTIDGAATFTLSQYDSITIVSTGTNWIII
jgi:hypothetical protein